LFVLNLLFLLDTKSFQFFIILRLFSNFLFNNN